MPKEKSKKLLSVESLRYSEYYDQQETFDNLYAKSKSGEKFTNLMELILKRENILLAYGAIKGNSGSVTPGTDNLNIKDIGSLTPDEMVEKVKAVVQGGKWGYRPKPVRRKDIPKPDGSTRPLGIPCIWDRLIQQCIKQILEPICEAKFSDNSYGFRPNRSVEHAIQKTYKLIQNSHLHYVVEFDIKGFFDNVNHSKLIRQMWTMGIHDKQLIFIVKRIMSAPIRMPNGTTVNPEKGTPQGGIISPLLANIVLNELDQWVDSQWQRNPVTRKYSIRINNSGYEILSHGYRAMKKTNLKEMLIVRYADDFRIFCRTKTQAERLKIAVTQWLSERLKLEVSQEKTRVVNVKRRHSEFLGFKIKVHTKGSKEVVKSHMADKQLKRVRKELVKQVKEIAKPKHGRTEYDEIRLYNSKVMGTQNYYRTATHINIDCAGLNRSVMTVLTNRLHGKRLKRKGRELNQVEKERYGKTRMMRYSADEPIYPISYIKHKNPMAQKRNICSYTVEGREGIHDNLRVNVSLMQKLMRQPLKGRSAEYADNRISLFSAQWGKCAVTGMEFQNLNDIHCHHKTPRVKGGTDKFENLTLVLETVHILIHAKSEETIAKYTESLNLNPDQMEKLNKLRQMAGRAKIN